MNKQRGGINHPNYQDLTGWKVGNLHVLEYVNIPNKKGIAKWVWKCECKCGKIIYVRTSCLNGIEKTQENCRSCQVPLNTKKRILKDYGAIKNGLYLKYKNKAKDRNYSFTLSFKDFITLISKNCYYCGQEPESHPSDLHILREKEPYKRNGIDRKDNNIGYEFENCVPCCTMCNYAKLNFSIYEFSEWLNRLYNYKNKELWKD